MLRPRKHAQLTDGMHKQTPGPPGCTPSPELRHFENCQLVLRLAHCFLAEQLPSKTHRVQPHMRCEAPVWILPNGRCAASRSAKAPTRTAGGQDFKPHPNHNSGHFLILSPPLSTCADAPRWPPCGELVRDSPDAGGRQAVGVSPTSNPSNSSNPDPNPVRLFGSSLAVIARSAAKLWRRCQRPAGSQARRLTLTVK